MSSTPAHTQPAPCTFPETAALGHLSGLVVCPLTWQTNLRERAMWSLGVVSGLLDQEVLRSLLAGVWLRKGLARHTHQVGMASQIPHSVGWDTTRRGQSRILLSLVLGHEPLLTRSKGQYQRKQVHVSSEVIYCSGVRDKRR